MDLEDRGITLENGASFADGKELAEYLMVLQDEHGGRPWFMAEPLGGLTEHDADSLVQTLATHSRTADFITMQATDGPRYLRITHHTDETPAQVA